jgi:transcriptional regulator with XRE-family HTH domain
MRERINLTELLGPRDPKLQAEIRLQMNLAQELYDLRDARGLTQAQVAALTGTTPAVIESIEESDYDPQLSRRILDKLTKALEQEPSAPSTLAAVGGPV